MGLFDFVGDFIGDILDPITGKDDAMEMQQQGIEAQRRGEEAGIRELREAREQAVELQEPFRELGVGALEELGSEARRTPYSGGILPTEITPEQIKLSPLYQLQREEGEEAINRAAAARGGFGSTPTVERLGEFNRRLLANEAQRMTDDARMARGEQRLEREFDVRESGKQYQKLLDIVNIGRGAATTSGAATTAAGGQIASLESLGGARESAIRSQMGDIATDLSPINVGSDIASMFSLF